MNIREDAAKELKVCLQKLHEWVNLKTRLQLLQQHILQKIQTDRLDYNRIIFWTHKEFVLVHKLSVHTQATTHDHNHKIVIIHHKL